MVQNEQTANIILRLKDEFSRKLSTAGKDFQNFARSVDQAGAAIARTGMRMTAVGATMTAPFLAATKAMEKYSFEARNEMIRMDNAFLSLSQTIANAAMPAVRELNDNLGRIVNVLRSIDPAIMESIARWSLLVGQILLVSGTITLFVGKAVSLIGKMLNPITLIIAAIAGLTYAWIEHQDAFMKVLNAIDYAFNWWVVKILEGIKKVMEGLLWLSKVHPAMAGTSGMIQGALDNLNRGISAFKMNMQQANAGTGAFAKSFQNAANGATAWIKNVMTTWKTAKKDLDTVMQDTKTRLLDTAYSFSDGFADAFDKVLFEGESFGNSMKSLFAGMGRSILKDFVSTVGKNLFSSLLGGAGTNSGTGLGGLLGAGLGSFFGPIGTAIGGFLGGIFRFHEGGMIYAHAGLAPDEVPIIAQTGEGVLSRRGMAAIGGSGSLRAINRGDAPSGGNGITVVINQVVRAWDANDVYRNSKTLTAAIANEIRTNGDLRRAIKET